MMQDRVRISITRLSRRWPVVSNEVVSEFKSFDDLTEAVLASMHIPGFTKNLQMTTRFRGGAVADGGFTDNCPRPPKDKRVRHVTVFDYVTVTQVFRPPTMNARSKDRSLGTVRAMFLQEWSRGARACAGRLEVYGEAVRQERRGKRGRRGTLVDLSSYATRDFWFPDKGKARFVGGVAVRAMVKTVCDLLGLRWQDFITRT